MAKLLGTKLVILPLKVNLWQWRFQRKKKKHNIFLKTLSGKTLNDGIVQWYLFINWLSFTALFAVPYEWAVFWKVGTISSVFIETVRLWFHFDPVLNSLQPFLSWIDAFFGDLCCNLFLTLIFFVFCNYDKGTSLCDVTFLARFVYRV